MKKSELIAIKEILSDPTKWLKNGMFAVDSTGLSCLGDNPDACKFCALGAFQKIDPYGSSFQFSQALGFSLPSSLMLFNDSPRTTHKMLMARFDDAIQNAKV